MALERTVTELLQGRSLKDLDVFTPPTFDDEEVAEHANLETHFIDSSGLISWDMFKQDADYPFVDWSFSGTTEEEFATLMAIFKAEDKEVYIADYEHLGVYACRIIVPGMSDIYPAEDLWLANNSMGAHLRDTILSLPGSEWEKEDYLALIEQMDDEGLDDFTRVRELLEPCHRERQRLVYPAHRRAESDAGPGWRRSGTGADLDRMDHGIQCLCLQP